VRYVFFVVGLVAFNLFIGGFLLPWAVSSENDFFAFGGLVFYALVVLIQCYYGATKFSTIFGVKSDESKK
jgi:hypothetical protein